MTLVLDPRWEGKPLTSNLPATATPWLLVDISGCDMVEVSSRGEFDALFAAGANDAAIQIAADADFALFKFQRYPASVGPVLTRGQSTTTKLCLRSSGAAVALGVSTVKLRTP